MIGSGSVAGSRVHAPGSSTAYSRQPEKCETRSPGRRPLAAGAEATSPIAPSGRVSPGRNAGNGTLVMASAPSLIIMQIEAETRK